jgi:hypothetical protein
VVRRLLLLVAAAVVAGWPVAAGAQDDPPSDPSGRRPLVEVPPGCDSPPLADVVFVGRVDTIAASLRPGETPSPANQTARLRLVQVRAGDASRFSFNGMIDVRYGVDAKYLVEDEEYLVGASVDPGLGVLTSKVREPEPLFGGDEVVGAAETDVDCPPVTDPNRTLNVDGTGLESGVLTPLTDAKPRLLRALLLPLGVALAILFVLVAVRWAITGVGYGVGSAVRIAHEPREVRAARRSRAHHPG